MIHVGDITKLNGSTLEPVDCITGGSPCQDLSVAGKRAGLAGARSGLFMEQIRIVKEMREHDIANGASPATARPRFMVWENVPGAFSSNHGEDFQAVLSEIVKVADPDAPDVPLPPKGKWPMADAYYGDGWSVAYRVHDAQFWGVPQRRKRIALVADFGAHAAPEILFEREGVSGDLEPGAEEREEAARSSGAGAPGAGAERTAGVEPVFALQGGGVTSQNSQGSGVGVGVQFTLNAVDHHGVAYCLDQQGGKGSANYTEDVTPTVLSDSHGTPHAVAYSFDSLAPSKERERHNEDA